MAVISPLYMRAAAPNRPSAFVNKCMTSYAPRFNNVAVGTYRPARPMRAANSALRPTLAA